MVAAGHDDQPAAGRLHPRRELPRVRHRDLLVALGVEQHERDLERLHGGVEVDGRQ